MKKLQAIISASIIAAFAASATAAEPDMIVTNNGETIKAYNLDVTSGANIYYTLTEDADAAVQRIAKTDVLIIKLADGTKLDPSAQAVPAVAAAPAQENNRTNETYIHTAESKPVEGIMFGELYRLSDKKEFYNMTPDEMIQLATANEYDIVYDYSEASINGYTHPEFCQYFKPKNGMPADKLLEKFERTMVYNLNVGLTYKFNLGEPCDDNRFKIIVKFSAITNDVKSIGYIVAVSKETGNIAFRQFSTKAGRWNDFEVLLMEDAGVPVEDGANTYPVSFVSQAIKNVTYNFRKKGNKLIKKR